MMTDGFFNKVPEYFAYLPFQPNRKSHLKLSPLDTEVVLKYSPVLKSSKILHY